MGKGVAFLLHALHPLVMLWPVQGLGYLPTVKLHSMHCLTYLPVRCVFPGGLAWCPLCAHVDLVESWLCQVLKYLTGMPEMGRKWSRAKALLAPDPPIAQLLGELHQHQHYYEQ